jgi:agmatine/peptidylarginine deiminase
VTSYNAILTASAAQAGRRINGSYANHVIINRAVIEGSLWEQFSTRDSMSSAQINRSASLRGSSD